MVPGLVRIGAMERRPGFVDVQVVAHRAGNSTRTTLEAREHPVDLIEADVHVYRGRAEVRHAKVVKPTRRMWDGRRLCPPSTSGVPLVDIVAAAGADATLMIDLKCFTLRAASQIRAHFPDQQRIVVTTRNWWVLRAFQSRPKTRLVRSCGNRAQLWCALRIGWPGPSTGFAVHERRLNAKVVSDLASKSDVVFAWGATTTARCHELVDIGVTGLILDDLQILEAASKS
jgi:glycerophosphoryl diester phosphodiesterase